MFINAESADIAVLMKYTFVYTPRSLLFIFMGSITLVPKRNKVVILTIFILIILNGTLVAGHCFRSRSID